MTELTGIQKSLLIAGFLITGSINTVTKKWQFQSCGPSIDPVDDSVAAACGHEGWKPFKKPWFQNLQMFIGESLVIWVFLARKSGRAKQAREVGEEVKRAPFYIFLLPTCCDILGTGLGGVGMLYISASVWQMMRGSLIVFTAFWSMIFLKKKVPLSNWIAVFVSVVGLVLIGVSAMLDEDSSSNTNVPLGIFFTVFSQAFAAAQMVVEELFVKGYKAPPEQVVGSEGLWGIMMMLIILFVMYWIPGQDAGAFENSIDSAHMLFESGQLLIFVVFYLVSISFFNFFGVTIAGKLSAVHRTINDAMRTMIIWVVEIIVYYKIDEAYGTGWKAHTYLQLLGFALLVLGNLLKNGIVKIPGVSYDEPQAVAPAITSAESVSGSDRGVSLIAGQNPQEN